MHIDVKSKLEDKKMRRHELACRIGVTYPTITAIYNVTSTSIKFDILQRICEELECTPNDILVFDKNSENPFDNSFNSMNPPS